MWAADLKISLLLADFKLEEGSFRLDIRKKSSAVQVVRHLVQVAQ